MLGRPSASKSARKTPSIIDGAGRADRHRSPRQADPRRSRKPDPTTTARSCRSACQAGRRCCRDQGRCRHRSRDEGKEGPRRRRPARHPRCRGRRHRPRRRRRAAACPRAPGEPQGDNHDQDAGIKIVLRAMEQPLRRSSPTPATSRAWSSGKVVEAPGNFGFNAATGEYGDMVEMGVWIRPRSPAPRCRTPPPSPA